MTIPEQEESTKARSHGVPPTVGGSIDVAGASAVRREALALSARLQTTLDVGEQIELLGKAIRRHLDFDGLEYSNRQAFVEDCRIGREATHRACYELRLADIGLGRLILSRDMAFLPSELRLLESLLCGLVYPLHNALTYVQALRLASYDPLTGVRNRAAMQEALAREADLSRRQGTPLALLLVDADHFKRFNDRFGHAFGDEVLRVLANTIASTIRKSDTLFRYGGEEFLVLASHTGAGGAAPLAERIREAMSGITTIRGREVELSVSIGVAAGVAETPEALFERADKALYRAKHQGRNRVVVAG